MLPRDLIEESQHALGICNACRYCEAYCPVFPALERRWSFAEHDLTYLANLCHNCGECLYACQYAPPHEFGVNVPRLLDRVRLASYEAYCWPRFLGRAFRRASVSTALILALAASLVVAGFARLFATTGSAPAAGDFYGVIPHGAMVALFGATSLFVLAALGIGLARFSRDLKRSPGGYGDVSSVLAGLRDAMTLAHLHDSGVDCTSAEESRSPARRWFHHLTTGGFALTFASTCVAAVYDSIFGWRAPYAYTSVPVVLGFVGGVGLVVGPLGLLRLQRERDPDLVDAGRRGLDGAFIALLLLTSGTGLLLMALRGGQAMSALLVVHLGSVLALFVALPYGKFVHGIYRTAALIKYAAEDAAVTDGPLVHERAWPAALTPPVVRAPPPSPAPEAAPALRSE